MSLKRGNSPTESASCSIQRAASFISGGVPVCAIANGCPTYLQVCAPPELLWDAPPYSTSNRLGP